MIFKEGGPSGRFVIELGGAPEANLAGSEGA